jgi:hypothetical protein
MVAEIVMVKIVIDDWDLGESKTMMVQLTEKRDERIFVEGVAAGLQMWLERYVNVNHVEEVWYTTIEGTYEVDES